MCSLRTTPLRTTLGDGEQIEMLLLLLLDKKGQNKPWIDTCRPYTCINVTLLLVACNDR